MFSNSAVYLQKLKVLVFDVIHMDIILKLTDFKLLCQHLDLLFLWFKCF